MINTHAHFDHCFGNQRFTPVPIYGHVRMPAHLDEFERPDLAGWIAAGGQQAEEWREVIVTPPARLVDGHEAVGVGDRVVELIHLGRGHTSNDLVVHVPDAGAWLVGDLVEESGDSDVLVPGHGQPVSLAFAQAQQTKLAEVAVLIRELHASGTPAREAVAAGATRWPLPVSDLATAVEAGYAQLGPVVDAG